MGGKDTKRRKETGSKITVIQICHEHCIRRVVEALFSLFPFVDDEIATSLLIHECKVLVVLAASNCILILRALIIICSEEISLLLTPASLVIDILRKRLN